MRKRKVLKKNKIEQRIANEPSLKMKIESSFSSSLNEAMGKIFWFVGKK